MAVLSTAGGIVLLCIFVAFFILLLVIGRSYGRLKYPTWKRRERHDWVKQRQADVRQQQQAAAETRRKVDVAMRMNRIRQSQEHRYRSDIETGLAKPKPAFAADLSLARSDSLPPYERSADITLPSPSLQMVGRADSESSVPPYETKSSESNRNDTR